MSTASVKASKEPLDVLLNRLFEQEKWAKARQIISTELVKKPNDHWLLDRLSVTYYEERDYKKALQLAKKAYHLEPQCALVMWDLAGAYDANGSKKNALLIYSKIIRLRGDATHGHVADQCNEGKKWLSALALDSTYRSALIFVEMKKLLEASYLLSFFIRKLTEDPTIATIYSVQDAEKRNAAIRERSYGEAEAEYDFPMRDLDSEFQNPTAAINC